MGRIADQKFTVIATATIQAGQLTVAYPKPGMGGVEIWMGHGDGGVGQWSNALNIPLVR